jgi:transcriptional regulator with XRE-family HTH domain
MGDMKKTNKGQALACNLRRLRLGKGYTQKHLVAVTGCSSVAMIEGGRVPNPRYGTVVALAAALGTTVAALYREPRKVART